MNANFNDVKESEVAEGTREFTCLCEVIRIFNEEVNTFSCSQFWPVLVNFHAFGLHNEYVVTFQGFHPPPLLLPLTHTTLKQTGSC